MRGLVKTALRYIEIEKLAETSCIVSNGEYFAGASWTCRSVSPADGALGAEPRLPWR